MTNKKKITILGSTGSIGVQTLEVLETLKDEFEIAYLTANNNIELLAEQALKYKPKGIIVADKQSCIELRRLLPDNSFINCGREALIEAAGDPENDIVLSSLVGFSGVEPALAALSSGTDLALANKETLVSAGSIVSEYLKNSKAHLFAVDSEHSAIWQCLAGEEHDQIEKIILTASGGPFLRTAQSEFASITIEQALNHPNWSMGSKITIDSATLMNKGFEVIEAFWLFNLKREQIEVVVHPQSIVHSLVQFIDGSVKAQLGMPSMKIPISYALTYPNRKYYDFPRMDLAEIGKLTFEKPDFERFPCLQMAFEVLENTDTAPAILNSANEAAVSAFLDGRIRFVEIPKLIETALNKIEFIANPSISQIIETDSETRRFIETLIKS